MKNLMKYVTRNVAQPRLRGVLLLLISVLTLNGCGKSSNATPQVETTSLVAGDQTGAADPAGTTNPTTPSIGGLTIILRSEKNTTATESQKLKQAVSTVNQVMNSADFKDKVLNFSYQGQKQFVQNNGLTNEQIYQNLMAAAEKYPAQGVPDRIADLYVSGYSPPWYRSFTSAVAFTNQNDEYEYLYHKYFGGATVPEIANTIIHEWTHRMGFSHDFNSTAQRPYSVPYGIGGLVESSVRTYLGQ